ncbi:MAG: hypothetical protein V7K67_16825 [Nostoc sp.]|uniref:hypothetical protein n=1 Tax=Nostoc sp. TaxID=1180 RepID=UPI002FF2EE79
MSNNQACHQKTLSEPYWAKPRLRRSLLNDWKKGNCDFCCNFYSTGAPAPKVEADERVMQTKLA